MKFRLLTALWGAEFCDLFLRLTARSLLAGGNFPDLSRRHDATYVIITTAADAARIAPDPVFRALESAGNVELQTIDESEIDPANPSSHWIIWRKGIEAAKEKREFVLYIMPDVVYARGTLLDWASAFEQGYRAIFTSVPEVVLETTLRELDQQPSVAQRAELNLSVRELTDLFLKHVHPYHLCMLRDSRRWVVHPEFVDHVVRGAGFVQRIMGSHPFGFDPAFFDFNDAYVPQNNLDRIAFLPCSAISLEPLLKFMNLYFRSWSMTDDRLSNFAWWFHHYASDANDLESRHSYIFPRPGRPPAALARAHAGGDFYRTQCLASRMIFRLWLKLGELGCDRAAAILATAHYAGRLRRSVSLRMPLTVLVPSNAAMERAGYQVEGAARADRRRALLRSVQDHCFAGHHRFGVGQRISTTTEGQICEARRFVRNAGKTGKILAGPIDLGGMFVYVTDFIAAARTTPHRFDRARRAEERRDSIAAAAGGLKSMLVHPSLVDGGDAAGGEPTVKPAARGRQADAPCRQTADQLKHLVRDYVAAGPAIPLHGAEAVHDTRSRLKSALQAVVRVLPGQQAHTGMVRRSLRFFKSSHRTMRGYLAVLRIVKEPSSSDVRQHLLAKRMKEADAAARDVPQVWRQLAGDFVAQGHLDLGLYCRRRAMEVDPGNPRVRQDFVRELLLAGREDEASSVDGGLLQLWRALGGDLAAQGHPELALYCRRKAIEFDPGSSQLHKELVRELLLVDRTEEARRAASRVTHIWRELGEELDAQGYPESSRFCRRQASEAQRVEDLSTRSLRDIRAEIGLLALQEILADYAAAIGVPDRSQPEGSPGPLTYLGQYLAARNESLRPLRRLTRLLEQEPDFAEAWIEKAFCHWEAGEVVLAVEAALRGAEAKPRCIRDTQNPHPHAEAAELIARCLGSVGLYEEAIGAYRQSLSFDGEQQFLRVCLGQLLWRQGLVEDAMKEFAAGMKFSCRLANLPKLPRRLEELSLGSDGI